MEKGCKSDEEKAKGERVENIGGYYEENKKNGI
jgi:hypothetical protein